MTQKKHNSKPLPVVPAHDLTVVLSGENSVRASLRDGQLECPADVALRAYLAASLIHLANTLTALPAKGTRS